MNSQADEWGAMPSARATHASHRANLRCLGLSVGIAIALTGCAPPQGTNAHQETFDRCIMTLAGVFHAATPTIIAECDKQADAASGMSAGTAETQSGSGLQPASPTAKGGDAQTKAQAHE